MRQLIMGVHCSPQGLESEAALGIQIFYFLWVYTAIQPWLKLGCWGLGGWAHHRDHWEVLAQKATWILELSSLPALLADVIISGRLHHLGCFPLNRSDPWKAGSVRDGKVWLFLPKVVALCAEQPLWALTAAVLQHKPSLSRCLWKGPAVYFISHWKGCL